MKKVSKLLLGVSLAIGLAIAFSGCVSAGIVNPEQTLTDPCVITTTDHKNGDSDIFYDGTRLEGSLWGSFSNVVSSGNHRISVSQSKRYIVNVTSNEYSSTTTYIPYVETWLITYDFKPGKSYKIDVENAKISYNGKNLLTEAPGVIITMNEKGKNIEVYHGDGVNIAITEHNGGIAGSTYFGPFFGGNVGLGLWQYGPGIIVANAGPRAGLNIVRNKLGIILCAEAGGEFGFSIPDLNSFGLSMGYYYGGLAEFYFSKIGLGIGGGMTGGSVLPLIKWEGDGLEEINFLKGLYSLPYVEFDIKFEINNSLRRDMRKHLGDTTAFYVRYYFNNSNKPIEEWYNMFAVGIKRHW